MMQRLLETLTLLLGGGAIGAGACLLPHSTHEPVLEGIAHGAVVFALTSLLLHEAPTPLSHRLRMLVRVAAFAGGAVIGISLFSSIETAHCCIAGGIAAVAAFVVHAASHRAVNAATHARPQDVDRDHERPRPAA